MYADWRAEIDWDFIRKFRIGRLREQMKREGMDAILTMRADHVRYITSFRGITMQIFFSMRYAAFLLQEKGPYLFVASGDFDRAKSTMSWLDGRIQPLPLDVGKSGELFTNIIRELQLTDGMVGIDIMPLGLLKSIENMNPRLTFVDCSDTFARAKAIKCERELEVIKAAAEIAEIGMREAIDSIVEGVRELEVAARANYAMTMAGAEDVFSQVMSGDHSITLTRISTEKRIRRGDLVIIDLGCTYNGYNSDFARTVICGDPSDKQKIMYRAVFEALDEAIKKCKPGFFSSEVDKASRDVLRKAGYEKYWYFGVTGHGIGISLHEPPVIGEKAGKGGLEMALEEGNVIAIEPSVHIPGVGGIRLEEMVIVRKDEPEVITKSKFDEKLMH